MMLDPEKIFAGLLSLCQGINISPQNYDLRIELENIPGCYTIYIPGLQEGQSKLYPFHLTDCEDVRKDYERGEIGIYRLTTSVTGKFEMFNGESKMLPVCPKCLSKLNWNFFADASAFNLRDFFRERGYKSAMPEEILSAIWMGLMIPNNKYPDNWQDISKLYRELAGWRCEKCGQDCRDNPASLHVHHKNRIKHDTRIENLQVLCASCHRNAHNSSEEEEGERQLTLF